MIPSRLFFINLPYSLTLNQSKEKRIWQIGEQRCENQRSTTPAQRSGYVGESDLCQRGRQRGHGSELACKGASSALGVAVGGGDER